MPSTTNALLFARASLAIIFLWFGVMDFTPVGEAIVGQWLAGHAFLSGLEDQAGSAAKALGIYQIVMAVLIGAPLPLGSFRRIGFVLLGVFSVLALTAMLTNPVWLAAEGGFPAIGSGQGILKYVAIAGLSLWAGSFDNSRIFSNRTSKTRAVSLPVMWSGLVLVLAWIGVMKFTAAEAAGIAPLIASSPVFSWMQALMPERVISALIGVIEIFTALALLGYWFNPRLFRIGLVMSIMTFIVTLSFLFTYAGAWDEQLGGFPALSSSGHFLMKDLALLAVCFAFVNETRVRRYR
ncbi:YkgB family protein [Maricaulis sp.]|uniref:YkgB family protein n=1 Tax=Maricaulis sp. TaxID=1486257 RepID=UPI003A955E3C